MSFQHNQVLRNNYAQRERSCNNYNNIQKNNSCSTTETNDCEIEGNEIGDGKIGQCKGDDNRYSNDSASSASAEQDQADNPALSNCFNGYCRKRKEEERNSFMERSLCYWQENLYGDNISENNSIFKKK